ncbi:nucleotidyltransferase domain-containing protein [Humisphaera borealis]|uniref:Nucleotidyltransferase family protein n=1 Tax=Humisphaera borealis TaxID=2807512 RepID=A0A7M2WWA6_9BACT|nr:hypothetical protein [Humisphaera borealis]QOV89669.1 hypothetical protein IPV69_26355 [Humisphaera borealis]
MDLNLDPNFKDFIRLLNSAGVRYLLVGGYAVGHYGYERYTADIDFWIGMDRASAEGVSKTLIEFGFDPDEVRPEQFMAPGSLHMFGRAPIRIDLLTSPSGVDFEECYARRVMTLFEDVLVPVISLADLRVNKSHSGRDKDLIDLKHLPDA